MIADKIFYNGNIITMDAQAPHAEAIALHQGRVAAVGSNDQVMSLRRDGTEVVDLHGQTLLPGFNDSHLHLLDMGIAQETVDLAPARSRSDITRLGREFLAQNPATHWLLGWGWNQDKFTEPVLPSREDLDNITTELPILLTRTCGHIAVANSKALELAGIGHNPVQTKNGHIDLDAAGYPTGILREGSILLVAQQIPRKTVADYKRLLLRAAQTAMGYGLTSVQSDDLSEDMALRLQAYHELVQEGRFPLRVTLQIRVTQQQQIEQFLALKEQFVFSPHTVEYGPIKVMTDGSLGGRTAALNEPYSDDPTTSGVAPLSQGEINQLFSFAHQHGLQIAGHAIGDRAMEMLLDGFAHVLEEKPVADARPLVIHAQITTPAILQRCRDLGVVCDIQPTFVGTDLHIVEKRIGSRIAHTYAWHTMHQMGIPTAGGSDSPVETCNPLVGLYTAVTRQDVTGYPTGGWLPEENLTIEEALELFTVGSAYASFDEQVKGSIRPGLLADIVVLASDITRIPVSELLNLQVLATYIGGKKV